MIVYLSLPMTGRSQAWIDQELKCMRAAVLREWPGAVVADPYQVAASAGLDAATADYAALLAADLQFIMSVADRVVISVTMRLATNESKGVRMENFAALVFEKDIYFYNSVIDHMVSSPVAHMLND